MPNWELKNCCKHEQVVFLTTISICTVVILAHLDLGIPGAINCFLHRPGNEEAVLFYSTVENGGNSGQCCKFPCFRAGLGWAGVLLVTGGLRNLERLKKYIEMARDLSRTLWRTILLTPFKLITVFLHEASHAIACKLTCGQVEGIQVHANEGGVTQTRGGVYWLILPAGYLGSSFWGMVFILASTNLLTARIAAGCFGVALLIVLFVAKNWTLRGLCIGFIIFLGVIWTLQETTTIRILRYIILFIGVMNSLFSAYGMICNQNSFQGINILFVSLWIHVPWTCNLILRLRNRRSNYWHAREHMRSLLFIFPCVLFQNTSLVHMRDVIVLLKLL
ncbi:hypothetical protein HHK36_006934 [Tetracentron sinense]|uniref:Uncharacterized protein n=1 Tax=Tetracentron sinense TaxID=13715 RepID=A0A834ZMF3_TETSI|nr:hypothetical protein HHK36_006934 [Tetracentron sinense]